MAKLHLETAWQVPSAALSLKCSSHAQVVALSREAI